MAVYTHVHDEDLNRFLELYSLGEAVSFKGIAEGIENTNYLLKTTKTTAILTLFEKRTNKTDLPFFLKLKQYLSEQGFSCPQPFAQKDGALLGTLCGRPAILVSFLEGMSINAPTPSHCYALGKHLSKMHVLTKDFKLQRANTMGMAAWPKLFEHLTSSKADISLELNKMIAQELHTLGEDWPYDLPQGIIHADLFPDNVFFLKDSLSGFIDFYFACNDILCLDLAICMNAWCFERDGSFNITKVRQLLKGYQSERVLSTSEIKALPLLCRGSALRFLLTRLIDWHETPRSALVTPKNPQEYVQKLSFHQKVENASAYGLNL